MEEKKKKNRSINKKKHCSFTFGGEMEKKERDLFVLCMNRKSETTQNQSQPT